MWDGAGNESEAAFIGGLRLIGIALPATISSTSVSFKVKVGSSYLPLYEDDGTLYSITVAADRFVPVKIPYFAGSEYIKIYAASSEADGREIELVVRPV